jgi:ABC-type transport system involved in cytochrome c biogenesis permease component
MMKRKINSQNLRIIWAIAWKDILEGWKNKVILTSVITALFLVVFYYYLPELTEDELPLVVIYDPNDHIEIKEMENITPIYHRVEKEEGDFLHILRDMETPVIGIKVEGDPHQSNSSSPLILEGYYPYWMNASQVEELKTSAEDVLENIWDTSIEIKFGENIVYPVMDNYAYGKSFITTAGLLIQLAVMGLSMAPQLIVEEKDSQTLQAIVVSPATLGHFVLGKTLAVLFYSILTTIISLFFVGPLVIHWGLTIAALLIGMLTIIAPGILLGVLLDSKQQIQIWVWVMFIPIILPIFFSIVRVLPDSILKIIDWWPTVALARLLRAGFTLNPPINTYGTEIIYLISITIIFCGITYWAIQKQMVKGA